MKVLFLIDTLEGYGAEKSIVQIAVNMKRVAPVFVHLYKGDKLKPYLEQQGVKVYSLNIEAKYGYNEALKQVSKIIKKEKPKILHSSLFRADMVARRLKKLFPDLILVGSFVSNSYDKRRYEQMSIVSRIKLFRTQLIDRFTTGSVDCFICNSSTIQASNTAALHVPLNKTKVIYRGRCFNDFKAAGSKTSQLKKDLNLTDKKVFLNVGRLIKSKGQNDLLEGFRKLVEREQSYVLLIAGEGPLRPVLQKEIEGHGLQEQVHLLGYREDIPELLKVSDFFVFPSYYEGLPGALIEAIISKTPAIVSDIPEIRECFERNGALFFPPGDTQRLYEKLEEAVELEDWKQRSDLAYQYAQANFEIKKISKEYELLYKSLYLDRKDLRCIN